MVLVLVELEIVGIVRDLQFLFVGVPSRLCLNSGHRILLSNALQGIHPGPGHIKEFRTADQIAGKKHVVWAAGIRRGGGYHGPHSLAIVHVWRLDHGASAGNVVDVIVGHGRSASARQRVVAFIETEFSPDQDLADGGFAVDGLVDAGRP